MARRRVTKRRHLAHSEDLPWLAECSSCTWERIMPSWRRAFDLALRHSVCAGFGRG